MGRGSVTALIDLTREISEGMPVYPGDPLFQARPFADYGTDGFRATRFTIGSHLGTHVDAPCHYIEDGETVYDVPVRIFYGPCQVVRTPAEADGSYAIHALLPEGESFAEKWKETAASREYLVYLYAGEVPLAVAPLSDTEGRELIFRDFVIEGKSRLTAEDAAFATYLEFLFATMKGMPEHLALELDMEQFLLLDGRIDPDGSFVCVASCAL